MGRHRTTQRPITADAVRKFMLDRPDQKLTANEVAREFLRRGAALRPVLDYLVELGDLETCGIGRLRYYAPTTPRPARPVGILTTGPLKGYDRTLFSHARLAMLGRT